ncbi:MAG: Flp family type IVb pilin [Pseudohongiellaceae bacterium]
MKSLFNRFVKEDSGATMVEYAILVALISIAAIATITAIGPLIDAAFLEVQNAL